MRMPWRWGERADGRRFDATKSAGVRCPLYTFAVERLELFQVHEVILHHAPRSQNSMDTFV